MEVKSLAHIREMLGKAEPGKSDEFTSYACIASKSGTICVLNITNLTIELLKLSGMDTKGEIMGIYQDIKSH